MADLVTTFHMAAVVLDPFTYESSWIIDTAVRIFDVYKAADVRTAWVVTSSPSDARQFLGPMADRYMTFADEDRTFVRGVGLESLPAFVHIDQGLNIVGQAQGWSAMSWLAVARGLSEQMDWSMPVLPTEADPPPYHGSPALA